jgi:WD40 repeat protein
MSFSPDGKKLLFAFGSTLPIARMFVIPWPEASGAAGEILLRESPMERHTGSFAWMSDSRHVVAAQQINNQSRLDFIDIQSGTRQSRLPNDGQVTVGGFDTSHDRLLLEETRSNWGAWSYSLADGKLSRIQDTSLSETEPAWSPDGSTLAFLASYGDEEELWLKNLAAGWKKLLFRASATGDKSARFRAPAFSPDGSRIAVTVTLDQAIVPSGYAIYVILPKSGQATRLPGDFGTGLRPLDWSPDGRAIAFRELRGRLQVVDLESGKRTDLGGSDGNRSPTSWSRDGKWLARIDVEGVSLVSPDGKEQRTISKRILTNGADAPAHCFSADGSRLYLLRNEGAVAKLEELVLATDQLRTLTVLPGAIPGANFNRGMRLHPDGKSLVFTSGDNTTTFWLVDGVTAALNR